MSEPYRVERGATDATVIGPTGKSEVLLTGAHYGGNVFRRAQEYADLLNAAHAAGRAAARGGENDAATGAGDASVEGALDHPERSHQAATPSLTPNERAAAPHLHYPYGWDAACAECCREKSAFGRAAAPRGETP